MTDAHGARDLYRLSNVVSQPLRRHHAKRQFTGVQRELNARKLLLQEGEHAHVKGIVAH